MILIGPRRRVEYGSCRRNHRIFIGFLIIGFSLVVVLLWICDRGQLEYDAIHKKYHSAHTLG